MKRLSGEVLSKGSSGVSAILGGDGLLAAMLLGGLQLLLASPSIPKVGESAADKGFGDGSLTSSSEMIVAFCSLLLNLMAMCRAFGHSPHCGLPHGLSAYLPPVRGGVTWCIFWTTISLCMS
jgi:hypothetical protein